MNKDMLREVFAKVYKNDNAILSLAENNNDYWMESIAARHRWAAFQEGAKAVIDQHVEENDKMALDVEVEINNDEIAKLSIDQIDMKNIKCSEIDYWAEEYECSMLYLDTLNIPRSDKDGTMYSVCGRIKYSIEHAKNKSTNILFPTMLRKMWTDKEVQNWLDDYCNLGELKASNYDEAASLAKYIFNTHYANDPEYADGHIVWQLCDSTAGVISQINNMVSGLTRAISEDSLKITDQTKENRDILINSLKASKGWTTGYAEAFVDDYFSEKTNIVVNIVPSIDYFILREFAELNKISYNQLCTAVNESLDSYSK